MFRFVRRAKEFLYKNVQVENYLTKISKAMRISLLEPYQYLTRWIYGQIEILSHLGYCVFFLKEMSFYKQSVRFGSPKSFYSSRLSIE